MMSIIDTNEPKQRLRGWLIVLGKTADCLHSNYGVSRTAEEAILYQRAMQLAVDLAQDGSPLPPLPVGNEVLDSTKLFADLDRVARAHGRMIAQDIHPAVRFRKHLSQSFTADGCANEAGRTLAASLVEVAHALEGEPRTTQMRPGHMVRVLSEHSKTCVRWLFWQGIILAMEPQLIKAQQRIHDARRMQPYIDELRKLAYRQGSAKSSDGNKWIN